MSTSYLTLLKESRISIKMQPSRLLATDTSTTTFTLLLPLLLFPTLAAATPMHERQNFSPRSDLLTRVPNSVQCLYAETWQCDGTSITTANCEGGGGATKVCYCAPYTLACNRLGAWDAVQVWRVVTPSYNVTALNMR